MGLELLQDAQLHAFYTFKHYMETSRQKDALVALRLAKEPPVLISVAERKRNLDPPPQKRGKN